MKMKVNKSASIREYKDANPTATPLEISEALKAKGVKASPQMVSTVLSNAKKKGGKVGKPGRKPASAPVTAPASNGSPTGLQKIQDALALVKLANQFQTACDGIGADPKAVLTVSKMF